MKVRFRRHHGIYRPDDRSANKVRDAETRVPLIGRDEFRPAIP
jgi:hypothetical protein